MKNLIKISVLVLFLAISLPSNVYGKKVLKSAVGKQKTIITSLTNKTYSGDCTHVYSNGTNILIDAGSYGKNAKVKKAIQDLVKTKAYDKKNKTITLDYLIISHTHDDHFAGLMYLDSWAKGKKKVHVKNIYFNIVHFYDNDFMPEAEAKKILNGFVSNKNVTVDNLVCMSAYNDSNPSDGTYFGKTKLNEMPNTLHQNVSNEFQYINVPQKISIGNVNLVILPAVATFVNRSNYKNVNDSSASVVIYDNANKKGTANFKVIFPGDMEGYGLKKVLNTPEYCKLYAKNNTEEGVTYKDVYYRLSHHGKRDKKYYKKNNNFFDAEYDLFTKYVKPKYIIGSSWKNKKFKASKKVFLRLKTALKKAKQNTIKKLYYTF